MKIGSLRECPICEWWFDTKEHKECPMCEIALELTNSKPKNNEKIFSLCLIKEKSRNAKD